MNILSMFRFAIGCRPTRSGLILPAAMALVAWSTGDAHAQFRPTYNQQKGATLGGLGGAVAGAIIGDNNGEAGAGAAIGGVIGAVTGGLLGNAADKEAVYSQQRQYQFNQQQQAIVAQSSVSTADVVSMSRSGLGEAVIINQIQQRGVLQPLQVPDIISLHQQGVSERVISAMQQAPVGTRRVARAPQPIVTQPIVTQPIVTQPVIIEERVIYPQYVPRAYHYHRAPPARHYYRSGINFRF